MVRFRLYYDKDKEERWLNKMCQKGWAMTGFFAGFYTFSPCEKGTYTYRVDMPGEIGTDCMGNAQRQEYISFVEETGAEYICSWGWWMFFRKETAKGRFELYTDIGSSIAFYKRIRKLFMYAGAVELIIGIGLTWNGGADFTQRDPGSLAMIILIYVIIAAFLASAIKVTCRIRSMEKGKE